MLVNTSYTGNSANIARFEGLRSFSELCLLILYDEDDSLLSLLDTAEKTINYANKGIEQFFPNTLYIILVGKCKLEKK